MSVNIILHVGTEKTGSTSIQLALFKNTQALAGQGYLMPESLGHPCHIHLTACALETEPQHPIRNLLNITDDVAFKTFREKTLSKFKAEIASGKFHTVLITDEHINMHLLKPKLMEAYKAILDELGTVSKVIMYLRRQDELRISLYSEAVKAGNMTSFDPDNPITPFKVIPHRFSYLRILNRLSDTFGRDVLCPRIFRRDELIGQDSISDYLAQAGIVENLIDRSDITSNPSLDRQAIWAMAKITQSLKQGDPAVGEDIRRHMLERIQKMFKGSSLKMHPRLHQEFLSGFDSMNEQIKTLYFPGRVGPLFIPIEQDGSHAPNTYYPECSYSVQDLTKELTRREKEHYAHT